MTPEFVVGIQDEAKKLRIALKRKLYQGQLKRKRINHVVYGEYLDFKQSIEPWPASEGMQNSKLFTEYLRANMLLLVQLEQWIDRVSACSIEPIPPLLQVHSTDSEWEEYLFELEDRMEEVVRTHNSLYYSTLLELLQVLDAFERLKSMPFSEKTLSTNAVQPDGQPCRLPVEKVYKNTAQCPKKAGSEADSVKFR